MSAVAPRYAKALFALAKEGQVLERTADEMSRLVAVTDDPLLKPVLSSPLLSAARRRELARTLAHELQLSDLLTRFLGLLADHQRLGELPAMSEHFQRLLDREFGRVRITIRSATPLDPTQHDQLVAAFAQVTGKQVLPNVMVDGDLLGGVIVEVEGKVYDGSVRTQLDRLVKELSGTASL